MLLKTEWAGKIHNTRELLDDFPAAKAFIINKIESGEYKLKTDETIEEYLENNSHTGWIIEEFFNSLPDTYYIDYI